MIQLSYSTMVILITIVWCVVRIVCTIKKRDVDLHREMQLMLVYICIIGIVRLTFFSWTDSRLNAQTLVCTLPNVYPLQINLLPFVYMFDYPNIYGMFVNVVGNIVMFIPLGMVWPSVYKELDKPWKVILAGFGITLSIEILQLPFYGRISDIDDLILNLLGFVIGYWMYNTTKIVFKHLHTTIQHKELM